MGGLEIAKVIVDWCDGRRVTLDDRLDDDDSTTLRVTGRGRHAIQVDVYVPANGNGEITIGHLWPCETLLDRIPGGTRDERLSALARIMEDISFARSGRLWASVQYDDDASQIAILRPISEDGLTEDSFLDALADVAKTRRQAERAIDWVAELTETMPTGH